MGPLLPRVTGTAAFQGLSLPVYLLWFQWFLHLPTGTPFLLSPLLPESECYDGAPSLSLFLFLTHTHSPTPGRTSTQKPRTRGGGEELRNNGDDAYAPMSTPPMPYE